jgi:hypothetical protein
MEIMENWLSGKNYDHYKRIKDCIKKLYDENKHEDLPHFTPHGVAHCEAVEKIIHQLVTNSKEKVLKFTEKERFCLLASAWLHDIGMLPSVFQNIYPDETKEPSLIRERHHVTSAKYIVENYSRCGVEEADKELLAEICHFHRRREDLNNCGQMFTIGFTDGENIIRLRLLAAYLRLADSLHVDISRAPAPYYNICLTYSIPSDSKLHWIKSQVVNGIAIDSKHHKIKVSFKIPHDQYQNTESDKKSHDFEDKLNSIIRLVMNNLREELSSVMNVLLKYNITYFLDIEETRTPVYMSVQMKNDLNELVLNYDIMEHPSASRLLEMVIETVANIAGYNLKEDGKKEFRKPTDRTYIEVANRVEHEFLAKLKEDVKRNRPCHKGITNLITSINRIKNESKEIGIFVKKLLKLSIQYKAAGNDIKNNSSIFFKEEVLDKSSHELNDLDQNKYTILIFGYSESVIKALTGFREAIIKKENPNITDKLVCFGNSIEKEYSKYFRIFICEGGPKTKVAKDNRILYHDGSQYALALKRKNFSDIFIIPDIIVGNIIEKKRINYFLVGANGFDDQYFLHSAGHGSIIKIVNEKNNENDKRQIKTVLVVSNNKYRKNKKQSQKSTDAKDIMYKNYDRKNKPKEIESCLFWTGDGEEATREHIWLPRDEVVLKDLFDKSIMFFNPREDRIELKELDYVISNVGYHSMKEDTYRNNFLEAIQNRNQKDIEEISMGTDSKTKEGYPKNADNPPVD